MAWTHSTSASKRNADTLKDQGFHIERDGLCHFRTKSVSSKSHRPKRGKAKQSQAAADLKNESIDHGCNRSGVRRGSVRRENFDGGENRLNFKPRREERGTQYEENISAILSPNKNGREGEEGEGGQTDTSSIYVTGIFVRSLDPISGKVIYQFIQSIFGRWRASLMENDEGWRRRHKFGEFHGLGNFVLEEGREGEGHACMGP